MSMNILPALKNKLRSHSFAKNTLYLVLGTGGGAALLILATPFLSRLYSPESFGALAVYASTLSILLTISSLRYELAIVLPEDDHVSANLIAICFSLLLLTTIIISTCIWNFGSQFVRWVQAPQLEPYLYLFPFGILGGGAYQILSYWAIKKGAFPVAARTRFAQGVGTVIPQLSFGFATGSTIGLLLGETLGRFSGTLLLLRFAKRNLPIKSISIQGMREAATRYVQFPLLNSPASILTALSTQAPAILLSHFYNPEVAGYFALTSRILQAPATLLGQAVGQIFLSRAAGLKEKESLTLLTQRTAIVLFAVGLPVFAFFIYAGGDIFSTIFGEKWRQSGVYATLLAPWYLLWLIANPLSNLFTVREWQLSALLYAALECIIKVSSILIGARYSETTAVSFLGVSAALLSVATMDRFFKAAHTTMISVIPRISLLLGIGLVAISPLLFFQDITNLSILLIKLFVFLTIYSALAWRSRQWIIA